MVVVSVVMRKERRNKMITKEAEGRIPTKDELLEDYKNHPEKLDPDGWYLCTLDTTSGIWIFLRLSDGSWTNYNYNVTYYVRCVR